MTTSRKPKRSKSPLHPSQNILQIALRSQRLQLQLSLNQLQIEREMQIRLLKHNRILKLRKRAVDLWFSPLLYAIGIGTGILMLRGNEGFMVVSAASIISATACLINGLSARKELKEMELNEFAEKL
jgi:hypothetical protein